LNKEWESEVIIKNSEELEEWLFERAQRQGHKCDGVKDGTKDEHGLEVNIAYLDTVTGDEIKLVYECEHSKGITDYCLECGRITGGG